MRSPQTLLDTTLTEMCLQFRRVVDAFPVRCAALLPSALLDSSGPEARMIEVSPFLHLAMQARKLIAE